MLKCRQPLSPAADTVLTEQILCLEYSKQKRLLRSELDGNIPVSSSVILIN